MLADEISLTHVVSGPDHGRETDKDRFRRDLGNVAEAYQEVLMRLERGTAL